jgi:phthiocerol/phenolphthiocerol synthesis type-I polyketide synthase C
VTDAARSAIAELEAAGVRVRAAACDVTDREALAALLAAVARDMPPLRGIVHAATAYEDGLARNLTPESIRRVLAPKLLGAYYLHQLTLGYDLDLFVLFSSATTLLGNPGQGNYVAANAAIEALAAARRAAELPALCVRWGAIDDAGYLARNSQIKEALQSRMGGEALPSAVALDVLETLLLADRSGVGVMELDWRALQRFLPSARSPKFSELARHADEVAADEDDGDVRRLVATLPAPELAVELAAMLKQEIGGILRLAPENIDAARSIYDMGFDSLMGVELATAVEARFGVRLPVMAISESQTVTKLCARILAQLTGAEEAGDVVDDELRQVATRYGDEEHAETFAQVAQALRAGERPSDGRMIR